VVEPEADVDVVEVLSMAPWLQAAEAMRSNAATRRTPPAYEVR
jgi:hypothetical protein